MRRGPKVSPIPEKDRWALTDADRMPLPQEEWTPANENNNMPLGLHQENGQIFLKVNVEKGDSPDHAEMKRRYRLKKVPGFNIYIDRHRILRCYHRESKTAVDLKAYPLGSVRFDAFCHDLVRWHKDKMAGRAPRKRQYIYLMVCEQFVKIGISTHTKNRIREMSTSNPFPIKFIARCEGSLECEQSLHRRFKEHRSTGEWFHIRGEVAQFLNDPANNLKAHIDTVYKIIETSGDMG